MAPSPVRLQVVPTHVPDKPSDELLAAVRKVAARVPAIAARFGVEPTAARRGGRRGSGGPGGGRGAPGGSGGGGGGGERPSTPPVPAPSGAPLP